jgi:hypothetical protein
LQAFVPLQLLEALLHSLCPLQAFPPTHFTWADDAAELELSAAIALPTNSNATAVAKAAPVILVPFRIEFSLKRSALRAACKELTSRHKDASTMIAVGVSPN